MEVEHPIVSPEKEKEVSYALLMVKPHAYEQSAEVTLNHLLNSPTDEPNENMIKALNLPEDVEEAIFTDKRLTVCKTFIRDTTVKTQSGEARFDDVIDIFYGEDKEKRHYPKLKELYRGPAAFMLLQFNGDEKEMARMLKVLKGKETFQGSEKKGVGIRGSFTPPKENIDLQWLESLEDDEYNEQVGKIINNVVHITDTQEEAADALRVLLSPDDIAEMQERNIDIQAFIDSKAHER